MILRPVLQPVLRPAERGVLGAALVGGDALTNILAPIYSAGGKGLWVDPRFPSGSTQDSAGTTPITASGQQAGKWLDRSGNGIHLLQSSSGARPEWDVITGVSSLWHDRVDDGMTTAPFAAGTFGASMDLFILLNRSTLNNMAVCSGVPTDGARYIGGLVAGAGPGNNAAGAVGAAWTCWVDGVQVDGTANTSEDALHLAVGSGSYKLIEFRALDMSLWTQFTLGLYAAFMLGGDIAQLVLITSQSAGTRNSIRTAIGAIVGKTL